MRKFKRLFPLIPIYVLMLFAIVITSIYTGKAISTISDRQTLLNQKIIVIDAGHGGEDGGATSCSGVKESKINLEIALKLNDLFRIMGYRTLMIRTEDISIYKDGSTLSAKKVSDLKERVRIVNETNNAILISIHQNYFPDKKYSGAQVFYGKNPESKLLATNLQEHFSSHSRFINNRKCKKATGIYLMDNVTKPALLIECGFLSNSEEDVLLQDENYQKELCAVIVSGFSLYWKQNIPLA